MTPGTPGIGIRRTAQRTCDTADLRTGECSGHVCSRLLAFLWAMMVIASVGVMRSVVARDDAQPIRSSVNPNTAPWYELTVLPRIGEGMARRIVRYRESPTHRPRADEAAAAFQSVSDVARVRGIGPATLQHIGRHLRFDEG